MNEPIGPPARRSVSGRVPGQTDEALSSAHSDSTVVVLAGGTGGAKLARGMLDVVGSEELVVIANTGDDIDIYGAHVSPDPDLVSFWLADRIDERGWGIDGDTFTVMDALREAGAEVWFNLGDRDLAWCLRRRELEDEGLRPTEALARLNDALGVRARVLPMCDEPLRTWVRTEAGWRDFQRFMISERAEGNICEVAFRHGAATARPTPEVRAALARARAVILGPSNPVISIWPILSVLGEALRAGDAPVVCVSPVVGGEIVKGPTAAFLKAYGQPVSAAGVLGFYEQVQPGMLDGIVTDEPIVSGPSTTAETAGMPSRGVAAELAALADLATLPLDTAMADSISRARVAERTLAFTESLAG